MGKGRSGAIGSTVDALLLDEAQRVPEVLEEVGGSQNEHIDNTRQPPQAFLLCVEAGDGPSALW